ncbi:sulfotransferase [Jannaschia sp.]|nr:sulfotransferase [Jannaschia sp.]
MIDKPRAPVAIGGLGGSGTRIFAAMLQNAGFFIGSELNEPLDNLWFTVLFKREIWSRQIPDRADVEISIDLFRRAMTTGLAGTLTRYESDLLDELISDLSPVGRWRCGVTPDQAKSLIEYRPPPGGHGSLWGWKEPNTHLFLPSLDRQIDDLRYIHVVRNGLDMAFSRNTWQADHWSHHYALKRRTERSDPIHQLRYWIAANRRVIDYGQRHMADRFMVVDYDDFCLRPILHWPRLQQFLGRPRDTPVPDGFIAHTSIGRSKNRDISIFPDDVLTEYSLLQDEVVRLT